MLRYLPKKIRCFSHQIEAMQVMMREVGLEGSTAQEAHAHLQQLLCKTESREAASRRKFRHARRRHVRRHPSLHDALRHPRVPAIVFCRGFNLDSVQCKVLQWVCYCCLLSQVEVR